MKKIISILLLMLLCVTSCKTIQYVPVKGDTVVEYRDTTLIRDSIIYIPKETVKEVVPALDTLKMETSMAKSVSYVDTITHTLKGTLTNKKDIQYKYLYKDRIEYRDSIITKEVPVPVEVEKIVYKHYWYEKLLWILATFGVLTIALQLIKRKII